MEGIIGEIISVSEKWGCWVIHRMSSLVTSASSDSPKYHSVSISIAGSDHYWHCYWMKYHNCQNIHLSNHLISNGENKNSEFLKRIKNSF